MIMRLASLNYQLISFQKYFCGINPATVKVSCCWSSGKYEVAKTAGGGWGSAFDWGRQDKLLEAR